MITILDAAAALDAPWPGLEPWQKLQVGAMPEPKRAFAPSSLYAIAAVEMLRVRTMPQAMVCLSGSTGMMADVFEPARRRSDNGRLVGGNYARASRRIHPLTLIRSLQNQVPSALSQTFGIHGPVLNSLESATALAYLLPNMEAFVRTHGQVLLVLASAGNRREERAKRECFLGTRAGREGAFVFLLGNGGGYGKMELTDNLSDLESRMDETVADDPILEAGRQMMRCMIEKPDQRVLNFRDSLGHCAAAIWKGQ